MNLAVGDTIYAIFIIPEMILSHISTHPEGMTGKVFCVLLTDGNLAWIGGYSSVITLVFIATERYFAVIYPLRNKGKLSTRKLKVGRCDNSYNHRHISWKNSTCPSPNVDNYDWQHQDLFDSTLRGGESRVFQLNVTNSNTNILNYNSVPLGVFSASLSWLLLFLIGWGPPS